MGREAIGIVRAGKNVSRGTILLESTEIIFRGQPHLVIPFREMKSIKAAGGELQFTFRGRPVRLKLGPEAEKWAHKILHPPNLLDKLGVKPGLAVALVAVADQSFESLLAKSRVELSRERAKPASDLIFFGAQSRADLKRLVISSKSLQPAGALWIVYPKGRKEITEIEVLRAGRAAGLKDVKVCSFSATHTALKFVIPVARRS